MPVVLKVGHMAPRGPHQISKGPQENDGKSGGHRRFWVGHRNIIAWIHFWNLKCNQMFPSPLHHVQHSKQRSLLFLQLIWLNLFYVGWLICSQKYVTALMWWGEMIFAYHWPQCNWTFENFQVFFCPTRHVIPTTNITFLQCYTQTKYIKAINCFNNSNVHQAKMRQLTTI